MRKGLRAREGGTFIKATKTSAMRTGIFQRWSSANGRRETSATRKPSSSACARKATMRRCGDATMHKTEAEPAAPKRRVQALRFRYGPSDVLAAAVT